MATPEEIAVRVATLLSTVMNTTAILHDSALLLASDPADLRATLLWIVEELRWLGPMVSSGSVAEISWPADTEAKLDRLSVAVTGWDTRHPLTQETFDSAVACLAILQPTTPADHR
jgi:hypothetical protein